MNQKEQDNAAKDKEVSSPAEEEDKCLSPQDLEEFIKDAPPPIRMMFMGMMRESLGRAPQHPIYSKVTSEHIDKLLDYSHQEEENTFSLSKSNRYFHLFYSVFFTGVLIFLILWLAPSHKDLLYDILKILVSIAGGFGAGYGLKSYIDKRR